MILSDALSLIRDVPDFPKPGVVFKDMTPVFESPKAFAALHQALKISLQPLNAQKIVAIESRGFVLAGSLALELGCGIVLARKKGKLPRKTLSQSYGLEYGSDELHIHDDAIRVGERVVILDDVLATGGTLRAVADICQSLGGEIVGLQVVLELGFLNARQSLKAFKVQSLAVI